MEQAVQTNKRLFVVSARTPASLSARVERLRELSPRADQAALSSLLVAKYRGGESYMTYCVGKTLHESTMSDVVPVSADGASSRPAVVMVFSGQGPQHFDMGRQLFRTSSCFRATILRCDELYRKYAQLSAIDDFGLFADQPRPHDAGIVNQIHVTLPALVMVQVGLFHLWMSLGVQASYVVGHSFGEMCALYASGAVSLDTLMRLVATRARLMQQLDDQGRMLAIGMQQDQAQALIESLVLEEEAWIAAVNAPESTTIGGTHAAMDELFATLQTRGVFCRKLQVTNAYHTPLLAPLREQATAEFSRVLQEAAGEGVVGQQ